MRTGYNVNCTIDTIYNSYLGLDYISQFRFKADFPIGRPGGLCAHSITVAKRLLELADSMLPDCYSRDTLLTVALFHDVCKISTYKVYTRNAKNEATGSWEKVPFYKFEPEHNIGGDNHGSLSCFLIGDHGIRLTEEEYAAVNNHMGVTAAANVNTVWDCYEKHPLSWLLHAADEAATALDKV